jgi:hypothetical protein
VYCPLASVTLVKPPESNPRVKDKFLIEAITPDDDVDVADWQTRDVVSVVRILLHHRILMHRASLHRTTLHFTATHLTVPLDPIMIP